MHVAEAADQKTSFKLRFRLTINSQWRSQNAENVRTSKGDYWTKQRFSSIASLFKMTTSLKGENLPQRERFLSLMSSSKTSYQFYLT